MNEILSNNVSEKCLHRKGIVFMKYIIKILFSDSVDLTAQYRYERRSSHQCSSLDYVYLNECIQMNCSIIMKYEF